MQRQLGQAQRRDVHAWAEPGAPVPLKMPLQQALTGDVFTSIHEHDDKRLIYDAPGEVWARTPAGRHAGATAD